MSVFFDVFSLTSSVIDLTTYTLHIYVPLFSLLDTDDHEAFALHWADMLS